MDGFLNNIGKLRIATKRDGHCLARAVFESLKKRDFLPEFTTYKELLRGVVKHIKGNIEHYYMTNSYRPGIKKFDWFKAGL